MFSTRLPRLTSFQASFNSQRMFQKFMQAENSELQVVVQVRTEYDSIFDTLMEFLTHELREIHGEIGKDIPTVLRSWEAAKVGGLQVGNLSEERIRSNGQTPQFFDVIRKKWSSMVS